MRSWMFPIVASLSLLASTTPSWAQDPDAPPGLPTVQLSAESPVEELLSAISAPGIPQEEAQALFEELVALGGQVSLELGAVLGSAAYTDHARWVAGRALGRIADTHSIAALALGLHDPAPLVRAAACSGLGVSGRLPDEQRVSQLALSDPALMVQFAAIEALATLRAPSAADTLRQLLNALPDEGESMMLGRYAMEALASIGDEPALTVLMEQLARDDRPQLALLAQRGLEVASGAMLGDGQQAEDGGPSAATRAAWSDWWATRDARPEAGEGDG